MKYTFTYTFVILDSSSVDECRHVDQDQDDHIPSAADDSADGDSVISEGKKSFRLLQFYESPLQKLLVCMHGQFA